MTCNIISEYLPIFGCFSSPVRQVYLVKRAEIWTLFAWRLYGGKNPIVHHGNIWKSSHNLLGFYEGAFQKHHQFLLSKWGTNIDTQGIEDILFMEFWRFWSPFCATLFRKTVCVLKKNSKPKQFHKKYVFQTF